MTDALNRKYEVAIQPEYITQCPPTLISQKQVHVSNGQVFIRCPENPDEWMYLELQGELQSTSKVSTIGGDESNPSSHLFNCPLGTMTIEDGVRIPSYFEPLAFKCFHPNFYPLSAYSFFAISHRLSNYKSVI